MKKVFLFCLIVVILTASCFALGVTPARKTLDFEPNLNTGGSFKIINSEGVERSLIVQTRGELSKEIQLDKRRVEFGAGETESVVTYKINLPDKLSPGLHIGEIVISEEQKEIEDENTIVGATLSVVTQVYVYVPYPGKYAEAILNIQGAGKGEDVLFKLSVVSKGEFDLTNVYANVDIYSELNEKIDTFNTKSIAIKSSGKGDIVHNWNADVPVGNYKAVVTLIYDGESTVLEDTFQVGTESLELDQITVNNFQLGEIVKMEFLVENKWSQTIDKVHTQMQIYQGAGDILADFNSPDAQIDPLSKKVLTSYWDTAGVREGTYDAKVIIHYTDAKTIDTDLQLVVKSDSLEVIGLGYVLSEGGSDFNVSENLVMILIIIIGILILLNILWFLILRRSLKKK